jgi:hypothetical protein
MKGLMFNDESNKCLLKLKVHDLDIVDHMSLLAYGMSVTWKSINIRNGLRY